ncbi:P-loop ATPase, Sll1717 family [Kribbella sp. VKM Ac-2568]|uniref:P-loop ATPase, Sll1717 family n=1 Tax=Kribbella sp. VKM Ac-2568 TaxID=2512219 RepID=UPI00105405B6|nr:hypothetical protein [Kribbella sp. VKM Ac-2568]TCM38283.1 hypothetical protein EV648_117155 [Kribbella sp. VKM Ac-2568]
MARGKHAPRVSSGFYLGGQQAEADPLLEDAFYETTQYKAISSRDDHRCFIIGRTGSGKSAILRRLELQYPEHVIRITPEDLSLTYVADLQSIRWLSAEGVHLDPLFIALWKHVLLVEIIRHRYQVDSPTAKQNFLANLADRIKRDKSKVEALKYLDEFQGKFWCEADERVREIADRFETQIQSEAGVEAKGLRGGITQGSTKITENKSEIVARYQRIVNETQLPRLNQMIKVLDEDILDSKQNFTFVVIDDLDQDWVDDSVTNALIRCLFRAVLDLQRVQNLKVIVALRTNIFEALDFGRRTGGQEEKFRALSMRIQWSAADLEAMLNERAKAAGLRVGIALRGIRDLLPSTNKTRGDALEFILRRTLMRPRDVIAYLNECLEGTAGKPRITWDRIHDAESAYSRNRRLALRDEWKPTFPGIDEVFSIFEGKGRKLTPDQMGLILDDIAMLTADHDFIGTDWLGKLTSEIWNPKQGTWSDKYKSLVGLLFDIGFIGCIHNGHPPVFSYQDPDHLDRPSKLSRVQFFLIHPAFHDALDLTYA